jgi:hypothetical protein
MRYFIYYILLRIMDIMTTLLAVDKYSIEAEFNPFIRYLLTYPIVQFVLINLFLSIIVGLLFMKIHRSYKFITYAHLIFLAIVVINNIWWLLL